MKNDSKYTFKDFFRGALGGVSGLILSHPIDTIKSNAQTNKIVPFNLKSLYRGMRPPLFTVGFDKAMVFFAYENCKIFLDGKVENNLNKSIIAGGIAGLITPYYLAPIDRLKIIG